MVLFQPKQLLDRVHRSLHDLLHFGLRYVGVFGLSRTGRTIFARANIFDRAIAERQCDDLLASDANSGSNVIFRLGIGVSQTRNHTQTGLE
jgi:hypothetical protein